VPGAGTETGRPDCGEPGPDQPDHPDAGVGRFVDQRLGAAAETKTASMAIRHGPTSSPAATPGRV
jgi:hypothetical protein